ncbi:MAG: ribosomal-protein-alanine N-acetyltransferase [Flavobacteriales bacterium]|jgi:ribosomal-protein-alanine N-acetyltransferase
MNYYSPSQSQRLRYRLLTADDKVIWKRFFTQEKSTLYFPDFMRAPDSANIWIDKQMERYTTNRFGLLAIELQSTGEFIGQCGLLTQDVNGTEVLEIGYHLFEEHTGKGYAREAANHFKSLINKVSDFKEVCSIIHKENVPSQWVARSNGMKVKERTMYHGIEVDIFAVEI